MPRIITLALLLIALLSGITAPAQTDLSPWTAKFVVTHPNGIDTDTVWFGADTAGAFGYQSGLDVLDTNLSAPIRILAFDQVVEDSFGFGTCSNLSKDIKGFKTGWVEYTFYVVSDSFSSSPGGSGMARLSWDSTDFMFQNDSFSLDFAILESEYGYLEDIDNHVEYISGIHSFDSTRWYDSGNMPLLSTGLGFICGNTLRFIKLRLTILFNLYQFVSADFIPLEPKLLKLYPNPTSGLFNIQVDKPGIIQLIGPYGQVLEAKHIDYHTMLDLGPYPAGTYFVLYKEPNGQSVVVPIILTK